MKNNINNYVSIIILMVVSLSFTSCLQEEVNFGEDSSKVVPHIFDLGGPDLAFQSTTASYSVTSRGGSKYFWTASGGAEIQSIDGRTDMINVYFNQSGTVSISVYEQAANGLTSEVDIIEVEVTCNPKSGDYLVVMHDSYGDGWQTDDDTSGSGITVDIDGTIVEVGMCNPYTPNSFACVGTDYYDAQTTVTIPEGTFKALWYFPGDYWGEISFEVYGPDGVLVFASGDPGATGAGILPIVVCK